MRKCLVLFVMSSLFYITPLVAQPSFTTSDKAGAKAIKESILAVVLKEKDEKTLKKLSKKPEELRDYEASIEMFNAFMKQAVQKEWDFSREVQFVSSDEAKKLKEEKNGKYAIMETVIERNYKMNDFYSNNPKSRFNSPQAWAYHLSREGGSPALEITHAASPKKEIVRSYLPYLGVALGSLTFMVQNLENQLSDCLDKNITSLSALKEDIEKRESKLKTKKLMLLEPLISNGLQKTIQGREMAKYYSYSYEVVSEEKADAIITEKKADYAYIWIIPAGAEFQGIPIYNYFIIDAADGRPLFMMGRNKSPDGKFHQAHLSNASKKTD
ncbi:MAG: hypothetical protein V4714_12550 [Bacteroidota bacterium]